MKFYYEIIKSEWEIFPNEKVRIKRRISAFHYKSKKEAMKIAAELRKKDPTYRYDLGDRIYVRRCKNV